MGDSALKAAIFKAVKKTAGAADTKGPRAVQPLRTAKQRGQAVFQRETFIGCNFFNGGLNSRFLVYALKQVRTLLQKSQSYDSAISSVR